MNTDIPAFSNAATKIRLRFVDSDRGPVSLPVELYVGSGESRISIAPDAYDSSLLVVPPLSSGIFSYTLLLGGHPVLKGNIRVAPSNLPEGNIDHHVLATVALPHIFLYTSTGPQGEKGERGFSSYEIAVQHGYQGTEDEWVAELSGAQAAANEAKTQATAAGESATAAGKAQSAAETAATAAGKAQSAADSAAGEAGESATAATEQAENAAASATAATEQAENAAASATAATEQAENAAASATAATEQAENAAASATAAGESATAAGESATAAAEQAENAAESATAAAQSAETSADAAENVKRDLLPVSLSWLRTQMAETLGAGNFTLELSADETEVSVEFALDAVPEQCLDMLSVCRRVIPTSTQLSSCWFGGIPLDYTPLEFIESSGTQWLDSQTVMTNDTEITVSARAKAFSGFLFGVAERNDKQILSVRQASANYVAVQIGDTSGGSAVYEKGITVTEGDMLNILTDGIRSVTVNGSKRTAGKEATWESALVKIPFFAIKNAYHGPGSVASNGSFQLHSATIADSSGTQRDFVPVLRNSDNMAGLWDKVSRQFFENAGTGTFGYRFKATGDYVGPTASTYSLRAPRDPYYTAPSGVWARAAGENALDIVADTEDPSGDDWLHFPNTAAAYEHFTITPEPIEP